MSVFFFGLSFWCYEPLDPDLGWHLLGGLHVLDTGTVPRKDFINIFRDEWHDYHWLAQVFFAGAYRQGGFPALMICNGVLIAFLSLVIFKIAEEKKSSLKNMLLWFYAFACSILILSIRPQVLSILGIAISVLVLEKLSPRKALPILFLLSVCLCNMHVYWIFIPLLWGIYSCIPRILGMENSSNPVLSWLGLLLLALSGLICPYTFSEGRFTPASYTLILDYLNTPKVLTSVISEFESSLRSGFDSGTILLIFAAIAGYSVTRSSFRKNIREIILAGLGFILALFQIKFLPFLGIFGLPFLKKAIILPESFDTYRVQYLIPILGLVFAISTYPGFSYDDRNLRLLYPIEACEFLAHKDGNERVLTSFEYGGWCAFGARMATPGTPLRVMADGRTQQLPAAYFERLFRLYKISPGWNVTLDTWKPNYAVLEKTSSLAQVLGFAKGAWKVIFEDENFVVLRNLAERS